MRNDMTTRTTQRGALLSPHACVLLLLRACWLVFIAAHLVPLVVDLARAGHWLGACVLLAFGWALWRLL